MATQFGSPMQANDPTGSKNSSFDCVYGDAMNPTTTMSYSGAQNSSTAVKGKIVNASLAQSTTFTIPDPGVSAAVFDLSLSASAANCPDVIVRYITATSAGLATAGKVVVQPHTSATSQFAVIGMRVIKSTGLSGGGGDRLISLTDGTIVYNGSGITAALAGTPITTRPAGTGNPDCGTAVDPSASTAGQDIYLQYTGGTTDYSAGSIKVEVQLAQVTA